MSSGSVAMTRYVLDTEHLTLIERVYSGVASNLLKRDPKEIATAVITVEASLRGRSAMISRARTGSATVRHYLEFRESFGLVAELQVLDFTDQAEAIYQTLRTLKLLIGSQDLRIASIALSNSLILVTRNRSEFARIPGLLIEDWSSP